MITFEEALKKLLNKLLKLLKEVMSNKNKYINKKK